MLAYPSAIDLSGSHVRFLTRQLAKRRRQVGIPRRRLPPNRQALLVLAHLRCGDTCTRLGASFGVGVATVYRYIREAVLLIREAVVLLAAPAPTLHRPSTCGSKGVRQASAFNKSARTSGRSRAMKWPAPRTCVKSAAGNNSLLACLSEGRDQSFSP